MEERSTVAKIVRGGFWLYLNSIINNVFGFLYWMIISRIGGAEILGLTSTTIGLSGLILTLTALGIPIGMRRFLGAYSRDREGLRTFFWSSLAMLLILQGAPALALYTMSMLRISLLCFTPDMLRVASLLVALGVANGFASLLVSILRTDYLALATLLGNIAKLGLGIALVKLGFGWVGASIAYASINIAVIAIGFSTVVKLGIAYPRICIRRAIEVVKAGLASWVPSIVVIVGQQLAVLTVFGARGAIETGRFYVAYTIAGFVGGIAGAMVQLLLPVLSSMESGREHTSFQVLRLGMILVAPVAIAVALYPEMLLSLLGKSYVEAAPALTILSLSVFALIPAAAINNLVYSYGMYRRVLIAGLCQSVPRIALYAALVPSMGGLGAALSYTVGGYAGLAYLANLAIKEGYYRGVSIRPLLLSLAIPSGLALALALLHVPPFVGIVIMGLSYGIYARLGIVTRRDLRLLLEAFTSRGTIDRAYRRLKPVIDALLPE